MTSPQFFNDVVSWCSERCVTKIFGKRCFQKLPHATHLAMQIFQFKIQQRCQSSLGFFIHSKVTLLVRSQNWLMKKTIHHYQRCAPHREVQRQILLPEPSWGKLWNDFLTTYLVFKSGQIQGSLVSQTILTFGCQKKKKKKLAEFRLNCKHCLKILILLNPGRLEECL